MAGEAEGQERLRSVFCNVSIGAMDEEADCWSVVDRINPGSCQLHDLNLLCQWQGGDVYNLLLWGHLQH